MPVEYAQRNPGLNHVGHRFPTPILITQLPSAVEELITVRFRTAVVTNRVVYVGNVQKTNQKGEVTVEGDAMYKSSVNKFDTFADFRKIEASVADGDEIIKLEEFADRILQFKKKKMHLINVSQEIEFLEETFLHKGVSIPAAVCKTDYGVAWVNRQGCYLYDGEKVTNLLERKGLRLISSTEWGTTFTTANSIIGYVPNKRQIIVLKDCSASSVGDIYLYDIITQSWVFGDSNIVDGQAKTNFVNDWDGNLVCVHTSDTGTIVKWDDAPDTSTQVNITTKDIDFGQPHQRKKIYKVYVSYKGDGSNAVIGFGVDGITPNVQFANNTFTNAGTTDWAVKEFLFTDSSVVNNIHSFRIAITDSGSPLAADFEINDISIIFRVKSVK